MLNQDNEIDKKLLHDEITQELNNTIPENETEGG